MDLPFRYPRRNVCGIPLPTKFRRASVIRALESKMAERSDMPVAFPAPLPEEPSTCPNPERRAGVRFPFTAAAEVSDVRSEARVVGRCSDLGSGGCYVDTLSPFSVGSAVRIRIERDLREFEAEATVTYAHVSMGMGLAFTEIKDEHQGVLRSWIADLSGEQPPKLDAVPAGPEAGPLGAIENLRQVVNELINLMVRKKLLSENEAAALLRQMFR
jgi:hypothetical protein